MLENIREVFQRFEVGLLNQIQETKNIIVLLDKPNKTTLRLYNTEQILSTKTA